MSITIRIATKEDDAETARVSGLAFASVRAIYRPIASTSREAPPVGESGKLVAVDGSAIVGVVRHRAREGRLHLVGLAVHPDYQRRGIARELVSHAAAIARSRGFKELSLFTIEQTGNVAVFEKLGFTVADRGAASDLESATGQPLTEVFMTKTL